MKNPAIYLVLLAAAGVCMFGCAAKTKLYPDSHIGAPYFAPVNECVGEWTFSDDASTFDFTSAACGVALNGATLRLLVNTGASAQIVSAADYPKRVVSPTTDGWTWTLSGRPNAPDVAVAVTMNENQNTATLRATLSHPAGAAGSWVVRWVELPSAEGRGVGLTLPGAAGDAGWLQNGHDSWSFTGVQKFVNFEYPPRLTNGAPLPCANDYQYMDTCNGVSWWFGAIGGPDRSAGLLWGALSAKHWKTYAAGWYLGASRPIHLEVVQGTPNDPRALPPGAIIELEPIWLKLAGRPAYDLRDYADAVAAEVPPLDAARPAPFGWSTWSYYFSNISAASVINDCGKLTSLYPDETGLVCQIDDGYEQRFGDWTDYTTGFADGLAPVAAAIKVLNATPGLWMAPLLVSSESQLIESHPDWFLYDPSGSPVLFEDPFSSSKYYTLDITVPAVAAHLTQIVQQRVTEGFTYFKFDFLLAGAFEGVHADGSTAMEAYHNAMAVLRKAAGADAYIVGCGAPWLPTVGEANAFRGSPDVVGSVPGVPLFTTMANLGRFHGARGFANGVWFAYDPDNIVIRSPLTDNQAQFELAMVYMSGATLLGDSPSNLSTDRVNLLLSPAAEALRKTTAGRFWAPDLLTETVPWVIPTPAFDLLGIANAPPKVWVREQGDSRLVAVFAFNITPEVIQFDDRDLGVNYNGVAVARVFGSSSATLVRNGQTGWLANVPAQSAGVFLLTPD